MAILRAEHNIRPSSSPVNCGSGWLPRMRTKEQALLIHTASVHADARMAGLDVRCLHPHAVVKDREWAVDVAGSREDSQVASLADAWGERATQPRQARALSSSFVSLWFPDTARRLLSPTGRQGGGARGHPATGGCTPRRWSPGCLHICILLGSSLAWGAPDETALTQAKHRGVDPGGVWTPGGVWVCHLTLGKFLNCSEIPRSVKQISCQLLPMTPGRRKGGVQTVSDLTETCLECGRRSINGSSHCRKPKGWMGPETPPASEINSCNPGHPVRPFLPPTSAVCSVLHQTLTEHLLSAPHCIRSRG